MLTANINTFNYNLICLRECSDNLAYNTLVLSSNDLNSITFVNLQIIQIYSL